MMKLSFRNLRSSVQRLTSQYPLLVLSLVVLLFLSLDAIWSRDIISVLMTDDKHVALIFLIVISIIIGVGIYSRPCKHNILIHLTSIAGLGLWRYLMPDTFAMSHGIMIAIVGFISLLWLIRRPLPSWNHDVLSIHTRISDLLRHISLGALFAILLGAGLSAALGAIDALFSVSIDSNRYVTIFATSGIIVGLISAIDGILFDTSTWSTLTKPKIMLARIIGILIAIFGVILYVYLAQIIITWTWPSNEVARRGFVFVGLVLFGTVMLLPLLEYNEKTITRLHRRAHLILIPILIIISIAIIQRIQQYGITEARYLVILLLIIMTGTSIWHIITTKTSPYPLLVALSIGGLIAVFGGPIGMRSRSYHSQVNRLTNYLNEQNLLTNGQVTLPLDVTDDQAAVIAPLLRYFEDTNGRGLPQLNPERSNANELFVHTTMDRYADRGTNREVEDTYKFFHQKQNTIDSTGYTTLHTNLDYSTRNDNNANPSYTDTTWTYTSNNTSYTIDLSSIIEALSRINNSQELPTEWSIVESANARLIIATISIKKEGEKRILEDISGNLLVK